MFKLNICLLLSSYIFVSIYGFGFRSFHYESRKEPVINISLRYNVPEKWIRQPLNHFDVRDNRSWLMRYYQNDEFYNKKTGPILILLGGEWKISPDLLKTGLMYEIGRAHGAMMYYTEHRYYGKSRPVRNTEPDNLQYLSVDQALADIAYFIETKKLELNHSNQSVIVFGGSYAGNMAAWSRLKYPHLIQGALASSAPVYAKADFFEYFDVVADSLEKYDKNCLRSVRKAINTVEYLLSHEHGAQILQTFFNLCNTPDVTSAQDVGWIISVIGEMFATVVQYNVMESNGKTKIANICDKIMDYSVGNSFRQLAAIINHNKSHCSDWSYNSFVGMYKNTSWNFEKIDMRLWFYQTCTEYGYFQTSSNENSTFGTLVPLKFFIQMCSDLYGNYYNAHLLDTRVKRTNVMYGGRLPALENVIFTNGNIDPWHVLSIIKDINKQTPAILINGSSHMADLYPESSVDVNELVSARRRVRIIIGEWIELGKNI